MDPLLFFFFGGGAGGGDFFSLRVPTSVATAREKTTVAAKGSFGCFGFFFSLDAVNSPEK